MKSEKEIREAKKYAEEALLYINKSKSLSGAREGAEATILAYAWVLGD